MVLIIFLHMVIMNTSIFFFITLVIFILFITWLLKAGSRSRITLFISLFIDLQNKNYWVVSNAEFTYSRNTWKLTPILFWLTLMVGGVVCVCTFFRWLFLPFIYELSENQIFFVFVFYSVLGWSIRCGLIQLPPPHSSNIQKPRPIRVNH